MYLRRITITGFKSFAGKAVLDLEPGISAVVGPNGSGKSNLADAIRWALGEQNKGRLRLGGREEVVFAGTDKRPRASFAEVTLLFNNDDGAFPLDLTEVEMSRRLYRSGESDYRLGGKSVRLGDLQQLMAEAGFGANTYAVIGQGMIDSFLLSSPAERKLLFDEAAGIRGPELKRDAALRKLTATAGNLTRLRDIRSELEPRLASLERTITAAREQEDLARRLGALRQGWAESMAADLVARMQSLSVERSQLTLSSHRLRHEHQALEREQTARVRAAEAAEAARAEQQAGLRELEGQYEQRLAALADQRATLSRLEHAIERARSLRQRAALLAGELKASEQRLQDTSEELAGHKGASERANRAVERAAAEVAKAQARLLEIRQEAGDGSQQQYVAHALAILKTIAQDLAVKTIEPDQLRLLVHKAGRLLSHANRTGEVELLRTMRAAQVQMEAAMTRRETATEHQTNVTITQRSLEIDLAHRQAATERLREDQARLQAELAGLGADPAELKRLRRTVTNAEQTLEHIKAGLSHARERLSTQPQDRAVTDLTEAAARLERLQNQQATIAQRLAAIGQERAAIAVERDLCRERLHSWGLALPAAPAASGHAAPAQIERELTRIEADLDARQALQQANTAEYEEVRGRHGELAGQINDLEQAETDLQQIVAQLDVLIQERFRENFATLADHFSRYFTRLFGGGSASLELEQQENGEYGILIKASPKGKRLTNLSALSGGERAMAGVALLAAILNVNPSPFVVLDEIDAALDEANSGRLAGILEELSSASQLIVITHNRQTMQAAKVLFGVTMNEHHVSHLLSLRLEQAAELAAR